MSVQPYCLHIARHGKQSRSALLHAGRHGIPRCALPPCSSLRRACHIRRAPCKKVRSTFMDSVHRDKIGLFPKDAVIYIKQAWLGGHAQGDPGRNAPVVSANGCNASMPAAEKAQEGSARNVSLHMACDSAIVRFRWSARPVLVRSVSRWIRCPSRRFPARSDWYTSPAPTDRSPNSRIDPTNCRSILRGCNRRAPCARRRPMRHCRCWMQPTMGRCCLRRLLPSAGSRRPCRLHSMRNCLPRRRRHQRCRRWTSRHRRSDADLAQPDCQSHKGASSRCLTIGRRRCPSPPERR